MRSGLTEQMQFKKIVKKIKVVNKNERNVLDPSINKGHQLTQFSWFGHLMGWNHSIDF